MTDYKPQTLTGFGSDETSELPPVIDPGTYKAHLNDPELMTGDFGPQYKLRYLVPCDDGTTINVSEYTSRNHSPRSKFMDRIAAVNQLPEIKEGQNLSSLKTHGWVIIAVDVNEKGYNRVVKVYPMPPAEPSTIDLRPDGTIRKKQAVQTVTSDLGIDVPF